MAGTRLIFVTGVVLICLVSARQQQRDAPVLSGGTCGAGQPKSPVERRQWWVSAGVEACPGEDQWKCLNGSCIPANATCSGVPECADGSDESPRFCCESFWCGELCLPCSQRCDKVKHCAGGEDEEDCQTYRCPSNSFQCVSDGICVPKAAICNHTAECEDSSDENDCKSGKGFRACYNTEFVCDNGQCVRPFTLCDDYYDCLDHSDEKDCSPSDFVTCKSGKRVHNYWHCNNYPDCSEEYFEDDTDELFCNCSGKFECSNKRCIDRGNVCDSKCDCQDCGDEGDCSHVYVKDSGVTECLKGRAVECNDRCIAREFICDGINHCQGRDHTESGCYDHEKNECIYPETVHQEPINFFQCDDLRCVKASVVCDGRRDCLDGEDELNCGEESHPTSLCGPDLWPCWEFNECIPQSQRCDSRRDCSDGSDERYCANHTCAEDQWQCSSHHCVPMSARCDSIYDCIDKSDERKCDNQEVDCGPERMRCDSGQCVRREAWCNGTAECIDDSDEKRCVHRECEPGEWRCANGQCVPLDHRCVAFPDDRDSCLDLSHLMNCSDAVCGDDQYKCYLGPCYDKSLKCDGHIHCPGTWDDEDCTFECSYSHSGCECWDQEIKCSAMNLTGFPHVETNINSYLFAHNRIGETLHRDPVKGHQKVIYLDLCDNHITKLGNGTLSDLSLLKTLLLCNNNITDINYGNFRGLTSLSHLDLTNNQITRLGPRAFDGLRVLPKLDLRHQNLSEMAPGAFLGLDNLKVLLLSYNFITNITHPDTFAGLPRLETLRMSHNLLTVISHPDTFANLPLRNLIMDENPLKDVHERVFEPLHHLVKLSTPEFRFCCLQHHAEECLPRTEEFSSCEDLMSNLVLRVFVWVVGFVALVGNIFVIVWRLLYPSGSKKNHSMLFVNLALGDLLMGVYLLVIAVVDQKYRGVYRLHEREWRCSSLCKIAGFLSTFSSEASVFTLTVITLDRLTILLSPYGMRRVHDGLAKWVMVGVWVVSFILAAVPLFTYLPYFDNFYGRSGVCLALHITNEKPNGWEYSVFIFLVLNLLSFTIITISYILIYAGARDSPLMETGKTKHGKDREMGRRVTYIVGTDAACWLPIIMLGIASLSGAQIPRKVFAWVAVFVLPLNAALNPLIYTFFTEPVRKRLRDVRNSIASWHTRSTRSSVISGARMTSTYRGRVTTEVTDIPVTTNDAKVHTKAAICVYTPATSSSTQVIHFIHDPPDQGEAKKPEECPKQNGSDALSRPRAPPGSEDKAASEAEEAAIVLLETLTAERPATQRTSGRRYIRKKKTADQRYD